MSWSLPRRCWWTIPPCCSSTPAWSPSSRTSWVRPRRPTLGRHPCRRWCAPWTSTRSARPPGMRRSSRWPATSRSATTSRSWRSPTPGNCSPTPRIRVVTASTRTACGPLSIWTTTRPWTSGTKRSACRSTGFSAAGRPTTSGRWAFRARVAPVRRSTTTAAPSSGARVARSSTRTATSRSGTSSSCRTCAATVPPRRGTRSSATCPPRTSTPAWGWSAWRPCCRAWTTSTRSTRRKPSSRSPRT